MSEPRSASAAEFEHCLSFVGPGLKHTNRKRGAEPQVLRLEKQRSKGAGEEAWPVPSGLWEGDDAVQGDSLLPESATMTHSPDTGGDW